jgi:hypothetical protein
VVRVDIRVLFALFTLSGFTGLIYESLWTHYLKLFLGAAAFAQSFVLATFMGGMALGAWLASRWSARAKNLLAAYGWVEVLIGLAALVFHPVYVFLTQASLDRVIPALGSPNAVRDLQIRFVRAARRSADRAARHDVPADERRGDPPRAGGERPPLGAALFHQFDRRGSRRARDGILAALMVRAPGNDASSGAR